MQSEEDWPRHAPPPAAIPAPQSRTAVGDMLDLYHCLAQDELRWHLNPSLWPSDAMADPSLGWPMSGLVGQAGHGHSQFIEHMFVSEDKSQRMADAWPAVGLPVRHGSLSYDARSRSCRHVQRQAEDLRQSLATSAPAPGYIVSGHEHLKRSLLVKQDTCKAVAMPPQQAYYLVRNQLPNLAASPPAAATCNRHTREQGSRQKSRATTAPSSSARAVGRRLSAQMDCIGAVTGQHLPVRSELESPDVRQQSREVVQKTNTDPCLEEDVTVADVCEHGRVRSFNCTCTTLAGTCLWCVDTSTLSLKAS